jgi:ABC-type transport system involved in Fe-S cluster assembly fused permease/ATPase subunit
MKILLSLLVLLVATSALETITEDQLSQELSANRQLWLVHRSAS